MDKIVQRILDLKKEIQTPKIKLAIQKLQQSLYESKPKAITSEKKDKNNLAKNNDISIEEYLYNKDNR